MKYFRLADKAYRETVDLRLYEDDITAAVAKVKPDAQLFVECDGFYTIPELGKRESILVSQELRKNSGLNEYTTVHSSLTLTVTTTSNVQSLIQKIKNNKLK